MTRYRRRTRAIDDALAVRVTTAYGKLYGKRIDVDARFAQFQRDCLCDTGQKQEARSMLFRRPRLVQGAALCAGILAIAGIVAYMSVTGVEPTNTPSAGARPVAVATTAWRTDLPSAGTAQTDTPARATGDQLPSVRSSRGVTKVIYPVKPGASQLTGTFQPAGKGTLCQWTVTADGHQTQHFAVASEAEPVHIDVKSAKTVTVESSTPAGTEAPAGNCVLDNVREPTTAEAAAAETPGITLSASPSAPGQTQPAPSASDSGSPAPAS
jgi:hypothetical protein